MQSRIWLLIFFIVLLMPNGIEANTPYKVNPTYSANFPLVDGPLF